MDIIKSKENEIFKKLKKLKLKKYRDFYKLYLAEGRKFLTFDTQPEMIIFCEGVEEVLSNHSCKKIILSEKLFKELSSQENSQGIIVCYRIVESSLDSLGENIVILNRVSDPGNLGTIIRVTDAAGFHDIILTKGSADSYNDKTVRSSMGSILSLNIHYIEERDLIKFLKDRGYRIVVTALEKDSIPYTEMKLGKKNAFIFGNEGSGVTKEIIELCDEKIIIPIQGTAESLNVAMATGIILYKVREKLEANKKQ